MFRKNPSIKIKCSVLIKYNLANFFPKIGYTGNSEGTHCLNWKTSLLDSSFVLGIETKKNPQTAPSVKLKYRRNRYGILQPFLNNPYSMEVVLVIFKITAAISFPKKGCSSNFENRRRCISSYSTFLLLYVCRQSRVNKESR